MRKKNSPQYHSKKHPNTRGPQSSPSHGHTIANYETHTNSLSRGDTQEEKRDFYEFICCVDKMRRKERQGKAEKKKKSEDQRERGGTWELKRIEICCEIGKGKRRQKITLYFVQSLGNEKEEKTREKRVALWEENRNL